MHRPSERVNDMKLPATELKSVSSGASSVKASIQAPVRRLAKSLEKAAKHRSSSQASSQASARSSSQASAQSSSQSSANTNSGENADHMSKPAILDSSLIKNSKAARVTFTLLLVRPWVLVAGLWLVSLAGSAVAIQGLIKPRALMQALPEAIVEAPPVLTSSIIHVAEDDPQIGETAVAESEAAETAPVAEVVETSDGGGLPLLPIVALTGTCAVGCLIMSRRRAMARLSAARLASRVSGSRPSGARTKKGLPGRVRRKPVRADAARPIETAQSLKQIRKSDVAGSLRRGGTKLRSANLRASGAADSDMRGQSRTKKRRQRNNRATGPTAGAQSAASKNAAYRGRKQAQKAASTMHPARPRRVKRVSARPARQGMVSVVPASESHALDWTNGSLAHQMDVRQRKAM